jgi:hypothetical protein
MHPQGVHSALPGPALPGPLATRQAAAAVAPQLVRLCFSEASFPSHSQRV